MITDLKVARVYCAGPYTAPTRQERTRNVIAAERVGELVIEAGAYPVVPHRTGDRFEHLNSDWNWWMAVTSRELSTCDAMIVVPRWSHSKGTKCEITQSLMESRPVFFCVDDNRLPSDFNTWLMGWKS